MPPTKRSPMHFLLLLLVSVLACRLMDPEIRRTPTPVPEFVPPVEVDARSATLFDDFGDLGSGWEVGEYDIGSVGYYLGEYFVRCEAEDKFMWGQRFEYFEDVTIEVTARQVEAPDNDNTGYGVMCRVNYDSDADQVEGYAFLVSGDGFYAIARFVEGDPEYLLEWTESDIVRLGSSENYLRAICAENRLSFFVNGVLVPEVLDSSFVSGDVALIGVTYEAASAEFRFDHFSLSSP